MTPDHEVSEVALGSGSHGTVFKGKFKGKDCAVKKIQKVEKFNQKRVTREIDAGMILDHPCIPKVHDHVDTEDAVFIFMDIVEGKELLSYLMKNPAFIQEEEMLFKIFAQLYSALLHAHQKNIFHGDLKLENVLFDPVTCRVKLIDFGLCNIMSNDTTLSTEYCGTMEYVSPEIALHLPHLPARADIWSFGVFMYSCIFGCYPYKVAQFSFMDTVEDCPPLTFPESKNASPELKSLISKMLTPKAEDRITLNSIAYQDWVLKYTSQYTKRRSFSNNPRHKRAKLLA